MSTTQIEKGIVTTCKMALSPLNCMPSIRKVEGKIVIYYDVPWLASIISSVHHICGASYEDILHKMPMNLAMRLHVQYAKENGVRGITRRTSDEILDAQNKRMNELVVERLVEKGFVKEADKEAVFNLMMKTKDTNDES